MVVAVMFHNYTIIMTELITSHAGVSSLSPSSEKFAVTCVNDGSSLDT